LVITVPWGADAADQFDQLIDGGVAKVTEVVDGDTVILDNGRQVRLVGIQAPKLALGRKNFKPWPLASEAKEYLSKLILGHQIQLFLGDHPEDRYGRLLAHLVRKDNGLWVQGKLLKEGLARVYTFADNPKMGAEMLQHESQARIANKGMWGLLYYAVRNADTVANDVGTYQVVEDRIVEVAKVKKRIYLNFGPNWRTDFTVQIDARYGKRFVKKGIDLLKLKGQKIRVRGWVKVKNGPMIELDHPERLEILSPK